MNKSKKLVILTTIFLTAVTCLAVLFNVQIYTTYAIWKTPVVNVKKEKIIANRGNIYDRNGVLLAGTDSDGNRFYPENTAVHVLGALSSSAVPQGGTELAFDEYLTGSDGEIALEYTTVKGETVLTDTDVIPAENGSDVYLTIDAGMQKACERILRKAMAAYSNGVSYDDYAPPSGSAGAIVVTDVKSGEILAMASAPDYSLKDYSTAYDEIVSAGNSPLLNRAVQGLYRPGSTLKTITAFAALSEGTISPSTHFFCDGKYELGSTEFSCMNKHRFTSVRKALEVSCNIFFYKTSLKLGIDNLVKYEKMFGLGEAADFELPVYQGRLASPEAFDKAGEEWTDGQLIQAAIGQSKTECTPLQMAMQAQTFASRGVRYSPTLVSHIQDSHGGIIYSAGKKISALINDASGAFDTCIDGMKASTVYTYGEYALSALPQSTAIKTGTPQSPRGYDSAVIGFYPAENPEIAFSVMLESGANAKNTVISIIKAYLYGG